jgi:hypothetical protein
MTDTVWAGKPLGDSTLITGFWTELFEWPLDKIQPFMRDYHFGLKKSPEAFPKLFKSTDGEIKHLPPYLLGPDL